MRNKTVFRPSGVVAVPPLREGRSFLSAASPTETALAHNTQKEIVAGVQQGQAARPPLMKG
jgi:hypothetical protein